MDNTLTRLSLVFALLLVTTGCATNPVTGKSELTLISTAEEISTGEKQYGPAQQSQGGTYEVDPTLSHYVNQVGQRLAAVSDRDLPYEFVVINDSTPNAWALPGGKIAVNRGLLLQLENEAELAAVLGHEIVHAAARHGAKAMERAMLLQGAVMLTALSSQDSEYSNYIVGGASIGAQLINQRYGRHAELEADQYGMTYMARAGYDPASAVSLQEKFVAMKEGRRSDWLSGLFASHPPSEERVSSNQAMANEIQVTQRKDWEVGSQRFHQQLAYLSQKKPAYDAFDQATTLLADKEAPVALNRVEKAINLEPKEPRFYGLKADILFHQKNYNGAIRQYNAALEKDTAYYQYYLGRGLTYSKLGNKTKARNDLEKSNSLLPTALATNELGNLSLASGNRHLAKQYFATVAQTSGPLSQSARAKFVRLDLPDNPASYFRTRAERRNGQLYGVVQNAAGVEISSITVLISARINGESKRVQRSLGQLMAGTAVPVSSGWGINDTDIVDNVHVRVIGATL